MLFSITHEQDSDLDINEDPKNNKVKDDEDDDDEWETVIHSSDEEEEKNTEKEFLSLEEKAAKASEVTLGKVLTDEDFKRIDAAQLKKQVQGVRKGSKTPQKGKKRTADVAELAFSIYKTFNQL